MKKIKIIGKRNIEGITGKKDKKRSIIKDNITKELNDYHKNLEINIIDSHSIFN
mgnify:CR=1 FL=1